MRVLRALALIVGLVAPSAASQYFNTPVTSTATGSAWSSQAGQVYIAASSANVASVTANVPTQSTWTITLNGTTGAIAATSVSATSFTGSLLSGTTFTWGLPATKSTGTSTGGLTMADSILITNANKSVQVSGTNATVVVNGPGTTNLKVLNNVGNEGLVINHTSGQVNTLLTPYVGGVASPSVTLGSDGFTYDTTGFTSCDASGGARGNGIASIGFNTPAPNNGSGYPVTGGSCYGGPSFAPDGPQVWFNNNTTMFGFNAQPSHPNGIVFIGMSGDPLNHPNIGAESSGSPNRYALYMAPSMVVDDSGNAFHHFGLKVDAVEAVSTTSVVKVLNDQSGIFVGDGQIYSPSSNLTIGARYGLWIGTQTIGSVNYGIYDQSDLVVEDYAKFDGKASFNQIAEWGPAVGRSSMTTTGGINAVDNIVLTKASGVIQAHGTNAGFTANGPGTQHVKVYNDAGNEGVDTNHTQGQSYSLFQEYNGGVVSPAYLILDGGASGNAGIGTTVLPSSWTVAGSIQWGTGANQSTGTVSGGLNLGGSLVATLTGANIQASGTNATLQATGPGTTNLKVLNNTGNEGLVINHTSGQSYTKLDEYNSGVVSPGGIVLDGGATGGAGVGTTVLPSSWTVNGSLSWGMNGNISSGTVAGGLNLAAALAGTSASFTQTLGASSNGNPIVQVVNLAGNYGIQMSTTAITHFNAAVASSSITLAPSASGMDMEISGRVGFDTPLSSGAIISLSGTFSNAVATTCVSTITITLPIAGSVQVGFSGSVYNSNISAYDYANILVDGALQAGSVGAGPWDLSVNITVANVDINMSNNWPVRGLSAGTHNFCFAPGASAGTGHYSGNSNTRWWATRLP